MGVIGKCHKLWKKWGDDDSLWGNSMVWKQRQRESSQHYTVQSTAHTLHNAGSGRDENVLWWAEQRVGRQASEEIQGNSIERDPREFAANQKDTQWQSLEIKPGHQTFLKGFIDQGELSWVFLIVNFCFPLTLIPCCLRKESTMPRIGI